jgi:hypothetical protein
MRRRHRRKWLSVPLGHIGAMNIGWLLLGCAIIPVYPASTPVDHWSQSLPGKAIYRSAYMGDGPYQRNNIICVPADLGVYAGALVAMPLVTAQVVTYPIDAAFDLMFGDWLIGYILNDIAWLVTDIAMLGLGTPFLPFSYLAPQDFCEGWNPPRPETGLQITPGSSIFSTDKGAELQ